MLVQMALEGFTPKNQGGGSDREVNVTLTDPLWRKEKERASFLFLPICESESWYKRHKNGHLSLFIFSHHVSHYTTKVSSSKGTKQKVFVSTVFEWFLWRKHPHHPRELPQDLPGGKVKSISGGSNLDNWLQCLSQPYLLRKPPLQVNLLAKARHTWPSHTCMLIFSYLNPAPSSRKDQTLQENLPSL